MEQMTVFNSREEVPDVVWSLQASGDVVVVELPRGFFAVFPVTAAEEYTINRQARPTKLARSNKETEWKRHYMARLASAYLGEEVSPDNLEEALSRIKEMDWAVYAYLIRLVNER